MAMNVVQFQQGMLFTQFMRDYDTVTRCHHAPCKSG